MRREVAGASARPSSGASGGRGRGRRPSRSTCRPEALPDPTLDRIRGATRAAHGPRASEVSRGRPLTPASPGGGSQFAAGVPRAILRRGTPIGGQQPGLHRVLPLRLRLPPALRSPPGAFLGTRSWTGSRPSVARSPSRFLLDAYLLEPRLTLQVFSANPPRRGSRTAPWIFRAGREARAWSPQPLFHSPTRLLGGSRRRPVRIARGAGRPSTKLTPGDVAAAGARRAPLLQRPAAAPQAVAMNAEPP